MTVHRLPRRENDVNSFPADETKTQVEQDIGIGRILRVVNARRMTIAGCVAFITAMAALYVFQATPIYSATAQLMLGTPKNKVLDAEAILSGLGTDPVMIENQIQVIRSWAVAERVIKRLNLDKDPEFNDRLAGREGGLLSALNLGAWFGSEAPAKQIAQEQPKGYPAPLVQEFLQRLSVNSMGRSTVLRVSYSSVSPDKAARIANAVADQYIVDQLETKFDAAKRTTAWLSERLGELAEQVRVAEVAVEQYKAENGLTDTKDGQGLVGAQMSNLNAEVIIAKTKLAEAEAQYRQIATLASSGRNADAVGQVIASPIITALRTQQADLIRKEADARSRYGERHPAMIALIDEKRQLNIKVDEEVRRILASQQNEVSVARARLSSLERSLQEIQGSADSQSKARVGLRELERQAESNRTLYNNFLARFKSIEDQEQIQTPDARVIAAATSPLSPSFPNKTLIIGGAGAFSLFLGVVLAVMLDSLDAGFRSAADVEKALGLSNLAVVPTVPNVKTVQDRVVTKPLSAYTEAIRTLYAGVQLSDVDKPPKVILVSSSVPNEGKTSTSLAIARLVALGGHRVVLVDGDLRHPSVAKAFGVKNVPKGLVEVLAGRAELPSVMMRDTMTSLEYLPISSPPANPSDLITSDAMRRLIDVLRQHYDLVVVDAAPVIPVSDTRLLSRLVDKVVYVIHWDKTPREAVQSGIKMLQDGGADIAGTILNQTDLRRHAIYGYGYGYGGYTYGNYYGKYYTD